ncbi:hypothetical protein TSUD_69940 [Trifolium subterraneum]|uniref:Autophagy-related protein 13 N-terminal domain-containing protein n=1 Tax=Trifolium subterraneum TaxID=3900 RepID=A0A2Z6MUN9_TRISU|nr:hypothetical protein TSUD_69940 [Trifolium subterraneum]
MVVSHGNAHSDTARMEQIITEFFAKSVHIILESRAIYASSRNSYGGYKSDSSSSSSSSSVRPRDKWFNLALRECPVALENINNHECVIVDVILVRRSLDCDPMIPKKVLCKERYPLCCSGAELGVDAKSEKIVERWIVQYENRKKIKNANFGTRRSSNNSLQNVYKKSTLLLRSLYATVRLLPAYKTFRDLNSSAHIRPFTLAHRVSSFVEPFTRKQESEMMKYSFTPVNTSSGRLCLTVMYCPMASDLSCEQLPSMSPQVISDYVGSPLADPLRRFPSLPLAGLPCHGCSSPRRHSWNFDDSKASSTSINDSSLPIHSKSQILLSNKSPQINDLPPNPHLRGSRCTYKIDRSTNVMQTGATAEKVFSLGKDEVQKYSGVRISASSFPRVSISSRTKSLDRGHMAEALEARGFFPMRKSNDAAVGALVHMLKKAPPLHQDLYTSEHPSVLCGGLRLTAIPSSRVNLTTKPMNISVQKPNKENLSHGTQCETRNNIQELNKNQEASISTRKTTRDALEEFHGYREMKNSLVMRDIKPQI